MLRVLAAFGIVAFHSRYDVLNSRQIFYAGLVCFIMVSVWFCLERLQRSPRQHAAVLGRLFLPWVFWSCVFLVKEAYMTGSLAVDASLFIRFWAGTAIHLWYIPFIAAVMTLLWAAGRRWPAGLLEATALASLAALTLSAGVWRDWSIHLASPLPQYFHALFPVCAAVLVHGDVQRGRYFGTLLCLAAALYLAQFHGMGLPYAIGILACVSAFRLGQVGSVRMSDWGALADCMFGVYLVHPLLFYPWRTIVGGETIAFPVLVFLSATAIVWLVRCYGTGWAWTLFGMRRPA